MTEVIHRERMTFLILLLSYFCIFVFSDVEQKNS